MEQVQVNHEQSEHLQTSLNEIGNVEKVELSPKDAIAYGIQLGRGQGLKAMGKKGNFNMLSNTAKSLVIFGIMIGVGLLILEKFQASTSSNSTAYTEIGNVTSLFSDLTTWGAIVLIVIMGYVIMRYLGVFEGN